MPVTIHVIDQTFGRTGALRLGQQVEHQRQRVGRLRIRHEHSVGRHVFVAEGIDRTLVQRFVFRRILRSAQQACRAHHQIERMGVEALLDEGSDRHRRPAVLVIGITEKYPVAVAVPLAPQVVLGLRGDVVHPFLHAGVLAFEHPQVAVGHVVLPRNDRGHVAPTGRNTAAVRHGVDTVDRAVGILLGGHVGHPLIEEGLHVAVERRRAEEDLRVARPAQTLVALRAVGRNIDEVVEHPPLDIRLQPVDERVGRNERTVLGRRRTDRLGDEILGVQLAVDSLHLDVAEAVEGEPGREPLLALPRKDIGTQRFGLTQVAGEEFALFKNLGVVDAHRVAALAAQTHARAPRYVLAEVDHAGSRRGREDLDGFEGFNYPHGRADAGRQVIERGVGHLHRSPRRIVERRGVPPLLATVQIDRLAVVEVAVAHFARRGAPRVVGSDHLLRTVLVAENDLRQQAVLVAVVELAAPRQFRQPPPLGHGNADGIVAPDHQRRDVVSLILQPLLVGRPARCQKVVAHTVPVDARLVDAVGGHIDGRLGHGFRHTERAAEHRGEVVAHGRLDPACLPLPDVEQPRTPEGRTAPRRSLAAVVPHAHLPRVTGIRRQRRAVVKDAGRLRRSHFARPPDGTPAGLDADLVGALRHAAARRIAHLPAQQRTALPDPHGVGQMLGAKLRHGELRRSAPRRDDRRKKQQKKSFHGR